MYSLDGKAVFITGGADGLGKAFTEALLEKRCKVAFCDISEEAGRDAEKSFAEKFGKENVLFYLVDVTQDAPFEDAFNRAVAIFGRIDIFINNAGIMNEGVWKKMVELNVTALVHGTLMALNHMRRDKGGAGGRIVNLCSHSGLVDDYRTPIYNGTKHAVRSLTSSFAMEPDLVRKNGVELALLCPQATNTDLVRKLDNTMVHDLDNFLQDISPRTMAVSKPVGAMLELLQHDQMNGAILHVYLKGHNYERIVHESLGPTWPVESR